jgi:hypothetical protein
MKAPGYFPPGSLDPRPKLEELFDEWFSKHLRSMDEPALWPVPDNQPLTFRFIGLPTWDNPYAVRIEKQGDQWLLTGKLTAGEGGYDEGPIIRRVSGWLSPSEARRLDKLVSKLAFWELPTVIDDGGCDGVRWVVEAAESGRYHVAHRWCPERDDFARVCSFLGQLGGFHAR